MKVVWAAAMSSLVGVGNGVSLMFADFALVSVVPTFDQLRGLVTGS